MLRVLDRARADAIPLGRGGKNGVSPPDAPNTIDADPGAGTSVLSFTMDDMKTTLDALSRIVKPRNQMASSFRRSLDALGWQRPLIY